MAGRELPPSSPFAGDDGTADPDVAAALAALQDGSGSVSGVVDALHGTRVLVPVLAELEVEDVVVHDGHAHTVDKEASAGIVALQAPDGRTALPVFTSVAAMTAWRADARPVPSDIARAALSAVTEGWEVLVVDPGGPTTVLVPRPAVWALAQQARWVPAVGPDGVDDEIRAAIVAAVLPVRGVVGGDVVPGEPRRDRGRRGPRRRSGPRGTRRGPARHQRGARGRRARRHAGRLARAAAALSPLTQRRLTAHASARTDSTAAPTSWPPRMIRFTSSVGCQCVPESSTTNTPTALTCVAYPPPPP